MRGGVGHFRSEVVVILAFVNILYLRPPRHCRVVFDFESSTRPFYLFDNSQYHYDVKNYNIVNPNLGLSHYWMRACHSRNHQDITGRFGRESQRN